MLSLAELRRVARVLAPSLREARVEKWIQPGDDGLVVCLKDVEGAPEGRRVLLLSCRPGTARVSLLAERPKAPRVPPRFVEFLRANLGRPRVKDVRIVDGDRQLALVLEGKGGRFDLLLSLLGPRSNLYLVDGAGRLRASLRPLDKTRRDLRVGEPWRSPESGAPSEGGDRWAAVEDATLLEAVEVDYAAREREEQGDERARRLASVAAREAARIERKLASLRRDLEAAQGVDEDRRRGQLLMAMLGEVPPGAEAVEARDWESGETVRIALDPALPARENAERLFRRARKRARSVGPLEAQIAGLSADLQAVGALRDELEALQRAAGGQPDPEGLARLAETPPAARLLERAERRGGSPERGAAGDRPQGPFADLAPRLRPRRYPTAAGLEIWVGRSDEGNDHLTTRLARGKDLFLHLDGSPGSHVVLRTQGRNDPPSEALLDAAELAVHFSKQRDTTRADVHVAPIHQVSKPRGAKPGLVYVTGGRSLHLRRDPERLRRLLEARLDD